MGLLDDSGKEIIPPEYEELGWSQGTPVFHGEIIGYKKNGKWGLLSAKNSKITPPLYHSLYIQSDELILASKKGNFSGQEFFGIIDYKGKLVIPFTYAGLQVLSTAIIAQKHDYNQRRFGLIGLDNNIRLPFVYSNIYSISGDLLVVEKGDKLVSIANTQGKQVITYPIDSISNAGGNYLNTWENGKVGLANSKGESIFQPLYKEIKITSNSAEALAFNSWLFFKAEDSIYIEIKYDEIQEVSDDRYIVKTNDQYRVLDLYHSVSSGAFDAIKQASPGFFIVSKNNMLGLVSNDEIIIPIVYDTLTYDKGFIFAGNLGNRNHWSLFDTLGIEKSTYDYQDMRMGSEGRYAVKRNNKWGFIDRMGNETIHCVFNSVTPFSNGKSKVIFHHEQGVINRSGDWLIFPGKKEISIINDTLYLEKTANQSKLLSFEDELIYFTENEIQIFTNYLVETIDSVTKWRISFRGTIFDKESGNEPEPLLFQDSLFIITKESVKGIVTASGNVVIPFVNQDIKPGPDEFLAVRRDGFYGFVDMNNVLRVSNRYEDVQPFDNGRAAIKIRGKWGLIDKNETIIAQPIYQEIGNFQHGVCAVLLNNRWGLIDLNGNVVVEPELHELHQTENGNWISKKGALFGLIDETGKTILLSKYQAVIPVDNQRTIVKRKGKFGVADNNGVMLIGFHYDHLQYLKHQGIFVAMIGGEWTAVPLFPN